MNAEIKIQVLWGGEWVTTKATVKGNEARAFLETRTGEVKPITFLNRKRTTTWRLPARDGGKG